MEVTFFSLKLEDTPGQLGRVAALLSEADVNIEAFLADHGTVRLLTDDSEKAETVFKQHKVKYEAQEVIEIELPNRPGELARIATKLGEHGVNIVTTFGSASTQNNQGKVYISVADVDAAWDALDGVE